MTLLLSTPLVVSANCGSDVILNATVGGNITSPNYPNNYDNGHRCFWHVRSDEGTVIRLDILDFYTEEGFDFLNVKTESMQFATAYKHTVIFSTGVFSIIVSTYSNYVVFCFQITDQGNGTQLLRVSGQTNGSIFSDTNNVELYFTSDGIFTDRGFLIEYSQVGEGA